MTDDRVEFSVMVQRVRRLDRKCKLLSRQVELLCLILMDFISTERTRMAVEQIRNLQAIGRRHEHDAD